ncbi:MAG: hypothetical protein R2744_02910 [Bacteroidales bacterium]
MDVKKIIPDDTISIRNGGIEPIGKYRNIWIFWQLDAIAEKYGFKIDAPIRISRLMPLARFLQVGRSTEAVKYTARPYLQLLSYFRGCRKLYWQPGGNREEWQWQRISYKEPVYSLYHLP